MFGPLDAETVGLHFEGSRMFWLLLSKDLYSEADLQAWYDNATNLASRAIKPNPLESHLGISAELHCDVPPLMCDSSSYSDSGPAETAGPVCKRRRLALQQTAAAFRNMHSLLKFGSAGGHPYRDIAPDDIRRQFTPRELDVLDSAFLYSHKSMGDNLGVDESQSPQRMLWCTDGRLPSPCKRTLIWYRNRLLDRRPCFL